MRLRSRAGYTLALMVAINLINYADRYALASTASSVQKEFHVTDAALGLAGSAFLLVYAVSALPFGLWADRGRRRVVIGTGVAIWSVATFFTGLSRTFWQLILARAVLGVGEASYYPAGTSLLGDHFPKGQRGRAMSVWSAGTALGIAIGFAGGGLIAARFGWRYAFFIVGLPGLVLAALAFAMREPMRGDAEPTGPHLAATHEANLRRMVGLLRIPTLRFTIMAETALFFVLAADAYWLPIFLQRRYGMGIGAAGVSAGGVLVVGLLLGTLVGGWLADRRARTSPRAHLEISIAGFVAGAVLVAGALLAPNEAVFLVFFLLGAMALYLYNGPFTALKQNLVVPALRASAVTVSLFIEHLFGDSYSPYLVGLISDRVHSLTAALLITSPTLLLVAALLASRGLASAGRDTLAMEEAWAGRAADTADL